LGGAMTSLIFPKLIRSDARDGILSSFNGKLRSLANSFSLNDTMPTPLGNQRNTGKTKIAYLKMGDSRA
jgi:hypothetical protein